MYLFDKNNAHLSIKISAVTGQHSLPESRFANKTKMYLNAKIQEGKIYGLQQSAMRENHWTM